MNRLKLGTVALSGVILVGGAFALSACSSTAQTFLQAMNLSIVTQNGGQYFDLTTTFNMGNVSLAEATVDIVNPTTKAAEGSIQFSELSNGSSQISLLANTDLLTQGTVSLGQTLPNGTAIPQVLGAAPGTILGINILNNSTLYVGGSVQGTAYVGVALTFAGMDAVTGSIAGSLNLFFQDQFNSSLLGVGGIYGTSATPDESGVALFAKYTAPVAAATAATAKSLTSAKAEVASTPNEYAIEKLNNDTMNKLAKFFYGKHRKLRVK
jgi:hypothetical protein